MGPHFLLTATLLFGQVQEGEWVPYSPGKTFQRAGGRTQTRTYTQTWTSSGGWSQDRPGMGGFLGRVQGIFGRRGEPAGSGWRPVPEPDNFPEGEPRSEIPTAVTMAPPLDDAPAVSPAVVVPSTGLAPLPPGPGPAAPRPAATRPAAPVSPPPPAAGRIPLTPGGEITIEAVEVEPAPLEEVKPAAFDPARPAPAVHSRFAARLAHAADYSWIIGQLHIEKGIYSLHYANPGSLDRLGGILILEMRGDLSALRNGDLLHAQGNLDAPADRQPVYRPEVIQILERQ